MKDELGDRMKAYEGVESQRWLSGGPVCARIDGRSFSKFSKAFTRPYDPDLAAAMQFACKHLVENTHANIGFVQSDEISLIWDEPAEGSEMLFNGKVLKLTSVLASMTTAAFCVVLGHMRPKPVEEKMPHFDARVWTVPSQVEAANVLVWRSQDARKNGISSAARSCMSAKEMHGLNTGQMLGEMQMRGVNYDTDFPEHHRFGSYYQRKNVSRQLTAQERNSIPEEHRPEVGQFVTRTEVSPLPIRYFGDVSNRVGVVFNGEQVR